MFGAEVCTFGAPAQERTSSGTLHFKHTHARYPKILLVAYLLQRHGCLRHHFEGAHFWHRAFQTHPYQVSNTPFGGMFGPEVGMFGAPPQESTFLAVCILNTPVLGSQKPLLVAYLVHRYWCLGRHTQECTFVVIVHPKHTCARHPKTPFFW